MANSNERPRTTNPVTHDPDAALVRQIQHLTAQLDSRDQQLAKTRQQLFQANQKLEENAADIQMLEELGRYLTSSLAIDQVIEHIYQSFHVFDADVFLLGLLDSDNRKINVPLIVMEQQKLDPVEIPLDDVSSPAVWCVQNKKEVLIFECEDQLKYFSAEQVGEKSNQQMQTIVYQPLVVGDNVVGCLSIQNPEAKAFSTEQIDMIRTLGAYSAIAVANALGYTKLASTFEALKSTQKQLVLQEKMASLGTLTAGVAHEINNPVNFAHVGAENLSVDLLQFEAFLADLTGNDADNSILQAFAQRFTRLYEHVTTIRNGTSRIKSIVEDLRAFTQLDNSDEIAVDVAACLTATINLIRAQNINVVKFITDLNPVPELVCCPAQLNQVFMNIIVNGCDAIKQKQLQTSSDKPGQITITCRLSEERIVITVSDNGSGMSEATKSKLFEPFFTTKEVGKGTGLGMAMVFGIVEEHGGVIEVESCLGEGTLVTICLPLC